MSDEEVTNPRGWRGSETAWIEAAYAALIAQGIEAVRILPLARTLGMSRTSFYWHFADRDSLLRALVLRWKEKNTGNLVRRCAAPAATITEAMLNLFDCWIAPEIFDSPLEFAMRNWAQSDAALKAEFVATDAIRIAAIRDMFLRHGFADPEAEIRATTVYLTQIGYIAIMAEEPLHDRVRRMPPYVVTFTGKAPTPAELEGFRERHAERLARV